MLIDRNIHTARALLVDGNNLLRSVTAAQLRDAGVGQVVSTARVQDARVLLEQQQFDIVLCNRDFEGSDESGQDLLDELRRERLLPSSTVFLMVTGRALYHQVVEAAEGVLDGFLVRPYSAATLYQRLAEARLRKRELSDVFRALDDGHLEVALVHALRRFKDRLPFGDYCGRLAAELLLALERPADARTLFARLAELHQAPWARLGIARADLQSGDVTSARGTLRTVLVDNPKLADAHDLMGRVLVDQCDFDGALEHFRIATTLTPGCLLRAQHAGALAFYQGQGSEARHWLERTLSLGVQSKLFDALSLLLIAMLRFDDGDAGGVATMVDQLRLYRARYPDSVRLRRLQTAASVLATMAAGQAPASLDMLAELSAEVGDDDFDLEGANTLLALWSRMPALEQGTPEHESLVERIAMRFCVAKAMGEVLVAAARRAEPAVSVIRRCQAQVLELSEQAMGRAMAGDAQMAIEQLLDEGDKTLNAKLFELAKLLAHKHKSTLADHRGLVALAEQRLKRSCKATNHIAGIQRSGRSPHGMRLRGSQPQEMRIGTD